MKKGPHLARLATICRRRSNILRVPTECLNQPSAPLVQLRTEYLRAECQHSQMKELL